MEQEDHVELHPKWRLLAKEIDKAGYTYGDRIDHDWINEVLGLDYSKEGLTYAEGRKMDLERLEHIDGLKTYLLVERRMALKSLHSVGYLIVTPGQQTEWAEDEMDAKISKIISKTAERLRYTDIENLSDEQRKENVDAMARVAGIKSLVLGKGRLSGSTFAKLAGEEK